MLGQSVFHCSSFVHDFRFWKMTGQKLIPIKRSNFPHLLLECWTHHLSLVLLTNSAANEKEDRLDLIPEAFCNTPLKEKAQMFAGVPCPMGLENKSQPSQCFGIKPMRDRFVLPLIIIFPLMLSSFHFSETISIYLSCFLLFFSLILHHERVFKPLPYSNSRSPSSALCRQVQ